MFKRSHLFQTIIFGIHVSFWGCYLGSFLTLMGFCFSFKLTSKAFTSFRHMLDNVGPVKTKIELRWSCKTMRRKQSHPNERQFDTWSSLIYQRSPNIVLNHTKRLSSRRNFRSSSASLLFHRALTFSCWVGGCILIRWYSQLANTLRTINLSKIEYLASIASHLGVPKSTCPLCSCPFHPFLWKVCKFQSVQLYLKVFYRHLAMWHVKTVRSCF